MSGKYAQAHLPRNKHTVQKQWLAGKMITNLSLNYLHFFKSRKSRLVAGHFSHFQDVADPLQDNQQQ